ncbi:MAG: hypothetical protein RLZZ46_720 [Bacteroidota bacterium]|jgi:UDP-2,3-diacylglucosamine hydrolase
MKNRIQAGKEFNLPMNRRLYFISDIHLGVPDKATSIQRERRLCAFLRSKISPGDVLLIVGDLFDFWFEYKHVVPAGYSRSLGAIADLADSGTEVHFFRGNHDLWAGDYLRDELGIIMHNYPERWVINEKIFVIGHGDGLGPGDYGYKLLKKVFLFPPFRSLFRWLHPDIGISIARFWSGKSRGLTSKEHYLGDDKEWLVCFCKEYLENNNADYFVFGHRHLPLDIPLGRARYINLGEWFTVPRFLEFDGVNIKWGEIP